MYIYIYKHNGPMDIMMMDQSLEPHLNTDPQPKATMMAHDHYTKNTLTYIYPDIFYIHLI